MCVMEMSGTFGYFVGIQQASGMQNRKIDGRPEAKPDLQALP